jgi:hypothetical protein
MSTESEVKLARYSEIAKEADNWGRIIGVRRLKLSEQSKVSEMTSGLSGFEEMLNGQGVKVQIPHRMPYMLSAAVCMIDDAYIPFPRNRGELDAIYDRLDGEGLEAAGKAWIRLNPPSLKTDDDVIIEPNAETKNLSGTPSSA